jgi:phenylacetate-CoA ligase
MATYEELRQRHIADAATLMPKMIGRIDWSADRVAEHRRCELRRLVRVAKDLSPWHRKRLAGLDVGEVDETTLAQLPVMTKDDLMEHFDEIVTDDRLRLEVIEDHLGRLTSDAYLYDRYHACASGGSTGRRGVFVYDWGSWAVCFASFVRFEGRARARHPDLAAAPRVFAMVASQAASHMASSMPQTFSNPDSVWHRFPVTLPSEEIVAGLNATQPTVVSGYPSALHALTHEAATGRLTIAPRRVWSHSEPLLPEIRAALEATWKVPVVNIWGTSEAGCGVSCGESSGLHLSDDLAIVEPVDASGRPVGAGTGSDKLYLTNLYNHALPLIRYEITDQVTVLDEPCGCGSAFRRIADPHGRLDDTFVYDSGRVVVHPHVFRSPLSHQPRIVEYQVTQTCRGATVTIRATGPVDRPALQAEIAADLSRLGLPESEIIVNAVDHLDRQWSGKLKRFVALPR